MSPSSLSLIRQYFSENTLSNYYYINHVQSVANFALDICQRHPELQADSWLVEESAWLHDIGICRVNAPDIGCTGNQPYICHGILGAQIVMNELHQPKIARICETHVGVGITIHDIEQQNFPLPKRDMIPLSIEEQIVCYADKFFSKSEKNLTTPKTVEEIQQKLLKFGNEKMAIFQHWIEIFGVPSL
ncbi:MAG: HDIG domain-containing protein [Bacteroidales bacterium]|nr:HDIG domain-containing protein [Bacteroidales bacterium]